MTEAVAVPPAPPATPGGPRHSRRRAIVAAVVVVAAVTALLWQGLGNAAVYFKTADEAVAERQSLGDRRFRVEGVVVDGTVREDGNGVRFSIEENGATVPVRHQGDPPELFKPGIPVVLEGHWQGTTYESDRIMVRHTNEYRAENPDRVDDYPPAER